MVSLKQIAPALKVLGADDKHVVTAIAELTMALAELETVEVKGRENVDTMLGCMMAIDAIIGTEANDGR